jgi:hypothetical protein
MTVREIIVFKKLNHNDDYIETPIGEKLLHKYIGNLCICIMIMINIYVILYGNYCYPCCMPVY